MRKCLEKSVDMLLRLINRNGLSRKFLVLYVFCVILPLIVTDAIVINAVYEREVSDYRYDMEYVTSIYQNYLLNIVEQNRTLANTVNMNSRINEFLSAEYETPYDYYDAYFNTINGSFMQTISDITSDRIVVYADNEDILVGDAFKQLDPVRDSQWYKTFLEGGEKDKLIPFFEYDLREMNAQKRNLYYVKKMTYHKRGCEKVVVIENDCTVLMRNLKKLGNKYQMYISCGDYVLFNNMDDRSVMVSELEEKCKNKRRFVTDFSLQGCEMQIVLLSDKKMLTYILEDYWGMIIVIFFVTILLPILVIRLIQKSIVSRIQKLEKAFGEDENHIFCAIDTVDGTDEIATLMRNYNHMVEITNNLIKTVYTERIKEQENDIARKNAELLALQSQINPHFLFNALESIRMHSLLKGEEETSIMVGKLALMQRQNVEWGKDFVTIRKEMESIEAYLYLQEYRFGERLSFEIDVEKACEEYLIPKLTIVTFVENACVHGIESKPTQGWIFVRAYNKNESLIIEVEDTGGGMNDDEVKQMLYNINNVSIDALKEKKHVGILNACLRLKMITDNTVVFRIDSEIGIGMTMEIEIPLEKLERLENVNCERGMENVKGDAD